MCEKLKVKTKKCSTSWRRFHQCSTLYRLIHLINYIHHIHLILFIIYFLSCCIAFVSVLCCPVLLNDNKSRTHWRECCWPCYSRGSTRSSVRSPFTSERTYTISLMYSTTYLTYWHSVWQLFAFHDASSRWCFYGIIVWCFK